MEQQEERRQCEDKGGNENDVNAKSKTNDATDSDSSEKTLWQNCPDC